MSKSYVEDNALSQTAGQLSAALGLSPKSGARAVNKLQVRIIGDDEEVFAFTAKGRYVPLKIGRGLLSAKDVAQETGLNVDSAKNFLKQPFGFHTQNGIYSCVLKSNWKFEEK